MNANGPVDTRLGAGEGRRRARNSRLLDLTQLILVTTPGYVRMRRHPELEGWAADLVAFCERDELRPLAQPVNRIIELFAEGFTSFLPIFESLAAGDPAIGLRTLVYASQLSAENRKDRPYASLMLAWVALCAWVITADLSDENLHSEIGPERPLGWPNQGWIDIPAACIAASLELHGVYGATLLAEEAYAVLEDKRTKASGSPSCARADHR